MSFHRTRTEDSQRAVSAYFERQSAALAGKTIERMRQAGGAIEATAIDFTDGTTYVVAAMPWNWAGSDQESGAR